MGYRKPYKEVLVRKLILCLILAIASGAVLAHGYWQPQPYPTPQPIYVLPPPVYVTPSPIYNQWPRPHNPPPQWHPRRIRPQPQVQWINQHCDYTPGRPVHCWYTWP